MYLFLVILSAIIAFLMIGPGGIPGTGIALASLLLTFLTAYLIKPKTGWSVFLFASICLLSLFLMIRSNEFVIFLNVLAILYLLSLLAQNKKPQNLISDVFLAPFRLLIEIMATKNTLEFPRLDFFNNWNKDHQGKTTEKTAQIVVSLTVGVMILVVVSALLSTANPIFGGWVSDFLGWLNPLNFLTQFSEFVFLRLIFFGLLVLLLPKLASLLKNPDRQILSPINTPHLSFSLDIAKLLVLVVLSIFFVSQVQLYSADAQQLAELGISLSQKTREVFFQLSVVSLIILGMLYVGFGESKFSRWLSGGLIVYGLGLTAIALYSDLQYINSWGFTYARLYGLIGVGLITSLFTIMAIWKYGKKETSWFLQASIIAFTVSLVLVNTLNFDFLIYHFKKSSIGSGVDYAYLSQLSADSLSYKEQAELLLSVERKECDPVPFENYILLSKIEYLQSIYSIKANWRAFSLFGLIANRQIQQLDYEELKTTIDYNSFPCSPPSPVNRDAASGQAKDELNKDPLIIEAEPTKAVNPMIEVTLSEISESLYNRNYQILDFNKQQIVVGSLDFNKFNHSYGPGQFTIRLYQVEGLGEEIRSSVIYEKAYFIPREYSADDVENKMTL